MEFEFLGNRITKIEDLEEAIYEDMDEDFERFALYNNQILDAEDIIDFYDGFVEDEHYDNFCRLLHENEENFEIVVEEYEDPHAEAMRYYNSTRL